MKVAVLKLATPRMMGIGITATDTQNQGLAAWSLKESSLETNCRMMLKQSDYALSRQLKKDGGKFRMDAQTKRLLSQLHSKRPADSRIATIVEDIPKMSPWFHMCSFNRVIQNDDNLCFSLSKIALDNFCDMKQSYTISL